MILYKRSNMINWLPYPAPILQRAAEILLKVGEKFAREPDMLNLVINGSFIHSFLHEKLSKSEI